MRAKTGPLAIGSGVDHPDQGLRIDPAVPPANFHHRWPGRRRRPLHDPTSAISALPLLLSSALGGALLGGPTGAALSAATTGAAAYLLSAVNLAYIVSVGPGPYRDMSSGTYTAVPYSAEQQASLVEAWFAAGEPTSGDLYPSIRDYVRRGRA